uniref:Uncharacterized protein n=1 Tax=Opuntia streptacantha TaxID=393608 RepID=A0A7C9E1W1_OPUST
MSTKASNATTNIQDNSNVLTPVDLRHCLFNKVDVILNAFLKLSTASRKYEIIIRLDNPVLVLLVVHKLRMRDTVIPDRNSDYTLLPNFLHCLGNKFANFTFTISITLG